MKLKELLKKKDMHGAQLARRLGVSRSLVSYWIKGNARPSLDMIPKIAKALDLTTEETLNIFIRED